MNDEQMLKFAATFPVAIVFLVCVLGVISMFMGTDSAAVSLVLLPSLAAMISSTFLTAVIRKQTKRIAELEAKIEPVDDSA